MKKAIGFVFSLHRVTGTVIGFLFFMWFVSGLVLIYHPYPRLSDEQINEKKETLPTPLPDIAPFRQRVSGGIKNVRVYRMQGETRISLAAGDTTYLFHADTTRRPRPVTFDDVEQIACRWIQAPVKQVDTLHRREQWVLYSRYEKALPIYKFYFDDAEKHELFVSGRTGEVLQLTDASSRFWAWIGAIPHKFYLPFIRRNLDLWEGSITVGGLFALLAALSGMVVGIYLLLLRYRQRKRWEIPYRRRWYRLHFVGGLIFGIFMVAWGLSGMMSMQRIPQWMIRTDGNYIFNASRMWGKRPLPPETYRLDYRRLKETYPDLKEVSWTHFRDIPAYEIIAGKRALTIDASSEEVKELFIPEKTLAEGIRAVHGEDVAYTATLIDRYDNYYLARKGMNALPLPVYRVVVDDAIGSRYYIDPSTGYIRYFNTNKMVKKWVFSGIHYLNIRWLVERPLLWTVCIWFLCLGGAFVSLTGCWLGVRYLRRKGKKRAG